MKKISIALILFCLFLTHKCFSAEIKFTIPDEELTRIVAAIKGLYPIPQIENPEKLGNMIPEFTDNQWAKECMRRWIVHQVARWEQIVAQKNIQFLPDDTIIK